MSYSPKWQAAKDARRARRAADPTVQKRRLEHEQRQAREKAKHAGDEAA